MIHPYYWYPGYQRFFLACSVINFRPKAEPRAAKPREKPLVRSARYDLPFPLNFDRFYVKWRNVNYKGVKWRYFSAWRSRKRNRLQWKKLKIRNLRSLVASVNDGYYSLCSDNAKKKNWSGRESVSVGPRVLWGSVQQKCYRRIEKYKATLKELTTLIERSFSKNLLRWKEEGSEALTRPCGIQ